MKLFLTASLLLICSSFYAQELTYEDFKSLIPFLQHQDFKSAFERSDELLNNRAADTSDFRAQVAYINIYASAGMVAEHQMEHKIFESNLKKFVGKKLKMLGHPCVADSVKVAYNSFQFLPKDGKLEGFTMTANKDKTSILLFEYYDFNETYDPKDFIGGNVRATGILSSFEVNPNQSTIWIGRLHLSPAYVRRFAAR